MPVLSFQNATTLSKSVSLLTIITLSILPVFSRQISQIRYDMHIRRLFPGRYFYHSKLRTSMIRYLPHIKICSILGENITI